MILPRSTRRWSLSIRWLFALLSLVALAPVAYMLGRGVIASRNVAYMDDIDGTLMLLIRLHDGGTWSDLGRWLFEISNEHRMVTSRLLVVLSYGLSGTVNFNVMGVIGNLFLCVLCALLIRTAGTTERRWGMALLLAGFLFQLEHHENFFWSGSSIDHLQVPLLAGGTIMLLARGGWLASLGAGAVAALATFTLAHGLVVWPVGALMLVFDRRWRQLAAWLGVGAAVGAAYFSTFEFNPAHHVGVASVAGVVHIFSYWLELLGAPLALGVRSLSGVLGAGLLALVGWQVWSGGFRRERIALPLAVWAVGSLSLVAVGRANLADGVLSSRYYILGALAWALAFYVELQRRRDANRPYHFAVWLVPALIAFNVAADVKFSGAARGWLADRDNAVAGFVQHGRDGLGSAALHPLPEHATRVIRQAEELGVFAMPRQAQECAFPTTQPGAGFSSVIDRIAADENMVTIDGWAAIAGRPARAGEVRVVLYAESGRHVLTTSAVPRPDLAAAFPGESWHDAGFHFELRRWLLPRENYRVGLLIPTERGAEVVMTGQRLDLDGGAVAIEKDKVAPDRIVFDELVLRSPAVSVTAAPKKPMRVSFLDLRGNLVHVDFSGAGTLTIDLAESRPIEPVLRDHGRLVARLKGNASIAVTGADESTNLSIYSARRQPGSPAIERVRDGLAHIALVSIKSRNGQFGGLRTGNVWFRGTQGLVGIMAPDVHFRGPVVVGNINALASATSVLQLGIARDVRVAGGSLHQTNGRPVLVSGMARLRFVAGQTSRGLVLPARRNQAVLMENGADVSRRLAGDSFLLPKTIALLDDDGGDDGVGRL